MEEQTNPTSEQPKPVNTPAPAQSVSTPDPLKKKGGKKNIFIILGILAAIGIGIFLISSGSSSPDAEASPSPKSDLYDFASPEPTESPEPADRTEISIEVLNGTGIAGEASFLQGKLRTLGYEDIDTGNADSQDNETTTVTFSEDVADEIVEEITEELERIYEEVDASTSRSTTGADIKIETGLKKGQTPKPESTETPEATDTPDTSTDSADTTTDN